MKHRIKQALCLASCLVTFLSSSLVFTLPSRAAEELVSSTRDLVVQSDSKQAIISYSLPASATLRSNSFLNWRVKEISTRDEFGNRSSNLAYISYNENLFCDRERIVQCELTSIGRRAELVIESSFATTYNLVVEAEIVNVSNSTRTSIIYSNQQTVQFLQNPSRPELKYQTAEQMPKIIYESPDVGKDLQTVVRLRVDWQAPPSNALVSGPGWMELRVMDKSKKTIEKHQVTTSGNWVNVEVSQEEWLSWGGFFVELRWALFGKGYVYFFKEIEVPINFPRVAPPPTIEEISESAELEIDCPSSIKGGKISCVYTLTGIAKDRKQFSLRVETKSDSSNWKSNKPVAIDMTRPVRVSVPYQFKKSLSIRGVVEIGQRSVTSEVVRYGKGKPTFTIKQVESAIRKSMLRNCNSLPVGFDKYIFSEKNMTLNNYGGILTIYGIGTLRISVYEDKNSWQWGPASSADEVILDLWNCRYPSNAPKP